jgi:deoxyribodipyrimidine photo-lyase
VQRLGQEGLSPVVLPVAPTLAAAQARIAAVRPGPYARTRNALDGAVTGLSPYITHGLVSLTDVLSGVATRHALDVQHKLLYELGWRAYFRHVWQRHGPGIFESLHTGPLPDSAYASELPADIRAGATGVPVIDQAVRTLYASGTLHNHARMWLASYVVHLRRVHWRAGADWLYAHLLDGDLASNHLSWQWVAGTGSSKPYLFNADNVARYAPPHWHSPGSVIDTSYEALDRLARTPQSPLAAPDATAPGVDEPALLSAPPTSLGATAPDAAAVAGADVWLVHPWSLGALPPLPEGTVVIGLLLSDFHLARPWNPGRWAFVGSRLAELAPLRWQGSAQAVGQALRAARRVRCQADAHLAPWLGDFAETLPAPSLFPPVALPCGSFSQWWGQATRGVRSAADLLAVNEVPAR